MNFLEDAREAGDWCEVPPGAARALAAVVRAFAIPEADAEDVIQDVLLVYVVKRQSVESPLPWLYQVARHRCQQYWSAKRRAREESIDLASVVCEKSAGFSVAAAQRVDCERSLA